MLIIIRQQGSLSKEKLGLLLGSSYGSVLNCPRLYLKGGIGALVVENRGSFKKGENVCVAEKKLAQRLNIPKEGSRSFLKYNNAKSLEIPKNMALIFCLLIARN